MWEGNTMRKVLLVAASLFLILVSQAPALPATHGWPIEPTNNDHPIGNSLGEFQDFSGVYQHSGIDILGTPKFMSDGKEDTSAPWAVITVSGTISSLIDKAADKTQNGTTIQGTDGAVYRYWHFEEASYHKDFVLHYSNNTVVAAGDKVAKLTRFPNDFHHLHYDLAKSGKYLDPLADITPNPDPDPPEVTAIGLAKSGSDPWVEFKPVGASSCPVVSGKVDVVAQVRDRDGAGSTIAGAATLWVRKVRWRACPESNPNCAWETHCEYDQMPMAWETAGNAFSAELFSNRTPWDSDSDYSKATWLYGVVSKYVPAISIGGTPPLPEGEWDTTALSDGSYSVSVEATDFASNTTVYNVRACVQNKLTCTSELTIRDATDDKGAIPYPGKNWWVSPDITANPGTADQDKNINVGAANPIEVQVWNYGSCPASANTTYTVCLGWGLPSASVAYPLPAGQQIGCKAETVPAGGWPVGTSRITKFTWTPQVGSIPQGHHCLVAWVDMAGDSVQMTPAVNLDDNRAQQNITFQGPPAPGVTSQSSFWVNPQEMISQRSLVLSFQHSKQWPVLRSVRLRIDEGLSVRDVVDGDITGGEVGYGWTIVGIDPSRPLRLSGIEAHRPVRLTLELIFDEQLREGQFVKAEVVEYGLLPGFEEITPVGGLTLRFEPKAPQMHK